MDLNASNLNELKNKYRNLFYNLEKNPNHQEIERALMEIQQVVADLKAVDIKQLRQAIRKATQTSIAVLLNFQGKIRGLRKHGAGASTSTVSTTTGDQNKIEWIDLENAFDNRITTGMILNNSHKNLIDFLNDAKKMLIQKIKNILQKKNAIKVNTTLALDFSIKNGDCIEIESKYFSDGSFEILQSTDLNQIITENFQILKTDQEESASRGSGWTLHEILHMEIHFYDYTPLRGGNSFVEMPKWIINTHSVVNVQNNDNYCFLWSVLAALHPNELNASRVTSYYKYENELNLAGITFPISWQQIDVFEKLNNLKINVYGIEKKELNEEENNNNDDNVDNLFDDGGGNDAVGGRKKKSGRERIVPLYLSNNISDRDTIHLLMIDNTTEEEEEEKEEVEILNGDSFEDYYAENYFNKKRELTFYHFAWIRNLSRLTSSQINKHKGSKKICDRCLCHFQSQQSFENHDPQCKQKNTYRMLLPGKYNNIVKFRNYKYQIKTPFTLYCDSEAILTPIDNNNNAINSRGNKSSKSRIYQQHIPCSIASYMVCSYNSELNKFNLHRGENCIEMFIADLEAIAYQVDEILENAQPMNLTEDEELHFLNATECHICEKPFGPEEIKIREHNHLTSEYRGAAHQSCNLNYQDSCVIPVIFHNLGYDCHFFIKQLQSQFPGKIDLLGVNKENYISFTKHVDNTRIKFRFIDSFRFLASSLDTLASDLPNNEKKITRKFCETDEQFQLLTKKGIYPYEYFSNWEKFNETQLPTKEQFFSQLNNIHITDADYEFACKVWNVFKCKNLGEYSDLYLRTDVTLLADVFESFRNDTIDIYNLDPAHYLTLPGLSWDAMLKHTNTEFELLCDAEMILFIEKSIRGGFSQCSLRHAKANNKYMRNYDVGKEDSYIIYVDMNGLYNKCMQSHLPVKNFKWCYDFDVSTINDFAPDGEDGFFAEVDFDYPVNLHAEHRDLPLAPINEIPPLPSSKVPKLLATLEPKKKYVLHYTALQQYLRLGLKLTNIHRVLMFKQSPCLKTYMELNAELRVRATTKFQVKLRKDFSNIIFGRSIMSTRKHRDIRIVSKFEGRWGARSLISRPNFHSISIMGDLIIVEMKRQSVLFNKPIYVGSAILDISKTLMYEFYYEFLKPITGDRMRFLYQDTDSFTLLFKQLDPYAIIKNHPERFDTSGYSPDNSFGIQPQNERIPGLMKDECAGKIMTEFIGLRSKLYTYSVADENVEIQKRIYMRAKGVKKCVMKEITFDDYKRCLEEQIILSKKQNTIKSKNHDVYTIETEKIALSAFDDKRQLIPGSHETLPWGYVETL